MCVYGSMQRKETVVNFPDCLYISFMVYSFDGYTFNQATVQDSETALRILLLSAM